MTIIICPVGGRCNFIPGCAYCFQGEDIHKDEGLEYDFDAIKKGLEEVWRGPYQGSDVCLHGGECLLTPLPELEKLFALISGLPWRRKDGSVTTKGNASIMTNGTLITDAHIQLFKKYNVSVGMSVDGPPDLNVYRGPDPSNVATTGLYNIKLNETIRKLLDNGISVSIICVLHRQNAGTKELRQTLGRWLLDLKDLGITCGRLNPVDSDIPGMELTNDELFQMYVNAYHWNKTYDIRWNPVIEMERNLTGENKNPAPCIFHQCDPFNTHTLSILPSGDIGCCDRTFGHGLYPRSASGTSCGRYSSLSQTECAGCKYWTVCGAGCPDSGMDGDWRHKTRWCEAFRRTYKYIEEQLRKAKPGIKLSIDGKPQDINAQLSAMGHGDVAHGDSNERLGRGHSDSSHGDSVHSDVAHGDNAHHDTTHGDIAHGDSSHADDADYKRRR